MFLSRGNFVGAGCRNLRSDLGAHSRIDSYLIRPRILSVAEHSNYNITQLQKWYLGK